MKGPKIDVRTARILRQSAAYLKTQQKKKGSSKPSRARVSTKRITQTKAVSKALSNFSENKFQGVNIDCSLPVNKPSGSQPISYHFFNAGHQLTGPMGTEFASPQGPLNLFTFPQGDANDERSGNYMYIKKSHIKFEVQMLPNEDITPNPGLTSTVDFRLIVVKANRKYNELGASPDAGNSLFLNTQNDEFGYDGNVATTFLNMAQPINKRKWLVYRDQRFTLSPPATQNSSGVPGELTNSAFSKYPVKKMVSFNLPVWKKTHFDTNNHPDNLDTQWLMILAATPTSYCNPGVLRPRNYRVNILGTTSAADN